MTSFLQPPLLLLTLALSISPSLTDGHTIAGSSGSSDELKATWHWSYLDATPPPDLIDSDGQSYPFKLGVADKDQRDRRGDRFVPAIRYAHSAVTWKDEMIITHGYHYDMSLQGGGAIWLSDTWAFHFVTHHWRRLHPQIVHPSIGPVARYAAVAVLVGGDMYLHGGDDGGHAEGLTSYKHAVYGDLWRFILTPSRGEHHKQFTWERVHTAISPTPIGHTSYLPSILDPRLPFDDLYRCQHGFALVPLGSQSILWQADSDLDQTTDSQFQVPTTQPLPYLFISHGLWSAPRPGNDVTTAKSRDIMVDDFDVIESSDVFVFSFRTKEWRQLKTSEPPPARFGHSLVYVPSETSQYEGESNDQPSGFIYLYGGFSRTHGNHGDLWRLSLQSSASAPVFTWTQLHAAYATTADKSPGNRGYFSFLYSPDRRLHVFGGARCEPGCLCSAEVWVYDLKQDDETTSAATDHRWSLLISSPYSPASRAYPARHASGHPQYTTYATADESIEKGYPTHRYKQSLVQRVMRPSSSGSTVTTFSSFLFGGESYGPSAYYQDVWQLDYTPTAPVSTATLQATYDLDQLRHYTTHPTFTRPLPSERVVAQSTFHQHQPLGGWERDYPHPSTPTLVWEWPPSPEAKRENEFGSTRSTHRHVASPASSSHFFGRLPAFHQSLEFWLTALVSMSLVLIVGLSLFWCWLRAPRVVGVAMSKRA